MENEQNADKRPGNGRILAGIFLLTVGGVLLLQMMGFWFPYWLFTWPMILIVIGLFLTLKHNLRPGPWYILLIVGFVFLFDIISPTFSLVRFIWPIIIIGIGLMMILKPKGSFSSRRFRQRFEEYRGNEHRPFIPPQQPHASGFQPDQTAGGDAEFLDSTAVFGGVRKVVVSKNFRGGEAMSVFGGHEIDLSRADIIGTVELELTQVFGGTKLIVPKHWNVKSEVVAFLGGIEDKRVTDPALVDFSKTLLLRGTTVLGGLDIRNY